MCVFAGKKIQSYNEKGELVPDDLILDMVERRMQMDDTKKGYSLTMMMIV